MRDGWIERSVFGLMVGIAVWFFGSIGLDVWAQGRGNAPEITGPEPIAVRCTDVQTECEYVKVYLRRDQGNPAGRVFEEVATYRETVEDVFWFDFDPVAEQYGDGNYTLRAVGCDTDQTCSTDEIQVRIRVR